MRNAWFLLLILVCAPGFAQERIPHAHAVRAADTISIDGRLAEFTWAVAPRVGRFRNIRNLEQQDTAATQASLAWDDANLYIAFACADPEPWGTMTERDDPIWQEEVVEVFLDPDGDGRNYAELEVSPNNVVVDLLFRERRKGAEEAIRWNIDGLRTSVAKYGAGWVAEIAIPWASLAKAGVEQAPRPGDRWRVGLYRIERPGGHSKQARIEAVKAELKTAPPKSRSALQAELRQLESDLQWLAWSPTRVERGFHDPERFGVVEFVP